ncbi:MAG: hypothetical protein K0S93_96 [Nitrososphaeraceae archaeon]|jgi:hypothetical protein|nr:hypothetical protein [Nitrososphaeraceae archaeon]
MNNELEIKVVRDNDEFKVCNICDNEITRTGDYYLDMPKEVKTICIDCVEKINKVFSEW